MSEYLGIYRGSVVDNNDPLGIGRVTVHVPAVLADQTSPWCDPIYPTVYRPNAGDTVWVQFVNGDPTTPIYFSSEAVTAEKIVSHEITADKLAFELPDLDPVEQQLALVSQQAQAAADQATQVKNVTDGWTSVGATTIDGNKITTRTVQANALNVVSGGGNLCANSTFTDTTYALPTKVGAPTLALDGTHQYYGTGGLKVSSIAAISTPAGIVACDPANTNYMSGFLPSTSYTVSVWTWNPSTGGVPGVYLNIPAGSYVTAAAASTPSAATDQWVKSSITFVTSATAGSGASKPTIQVVASSIPAGGAFWVGAMQLEVGNLASAYSPKTNEILPGTISTPMLKATAIDGMTVTGATVQTVATANRGVKMDANGLRSYNTAGTQTFSVDSNGNVNMTGSLNAGSSVSGDSIFGGTITGTKLQTATSGARVAVGLTDEALFASPASVTFYGATAYDTYPGAIRSGSATAGIPSLLVAYPPSNRSSGFRPSLQLQDGTNPWAQVSGGTNGTVYLGGTTSVSGNFSANGSISTVSSITANGGDIAARSGGRLVAPDSPTTSTVSPNAVISLPSGILFVYTGSSRHVKHDIEPFEAAEDLAALRRCGVFAYHYNNDPEGRTIIGFVLENMMEEGLHRYVDFDEEGNPLQPAWNQIAALTVAAYQDLADRLDASVQRVKIAEARLDLLTARIEAQLTSQEIA